MLVLVGLGNPGPKYAENRHNIGYMAVDEIVRRHSFGAWRLRFKGQTAEGFIGGQKVLCLKPTTFMNESGRSVGEVVNFYKLEPELVTVIYDELDLVPGKVRVKHNGGHGGHNGLRSIDNYIGKDYWRVRLGIGHPGDKNRVHDYVLSDFAKAERPLMEKVVTAVGDHVEQLVAERPEQFMNQVTMAVNPPRPKEKSGEENASDRTGD